MESRVELAELDVTVRVKVFSEGVPDDTVVRAFGNIVGARLIDAVPKELGRFETKVVYIRKDIRLLDGTVMASDSDL